MSCGGKNRLRSGFGINNKPKNARRDVVVGVFGLLNQTIFFGQLSKVQAFLCVSSNGRQESN